MKISVIQMDVSIGEPQANVAKVREMLEKAVNGQEKPDVIILPEMWNTGYALDQVMELADVEGQETKALFGQFAKQHGVNIIGGSVADRTGSEIRNTMYIFDRNGEVTAEYSKVHLFRLMQEEQYLKSGEQSVLADIEGTPAGVMICYDIRFPELTRKLALGGAKVLFVPAQWPHPRLHHWRTLLMARAIENQMYVVACNRVGTSGRTEFFGHSMIIDPWGEIVEEGGEHEQILTANLNLNLVDEVRNKIPVFKDRRPTIY